MNDGFGAVKARMRALDAQLTSQQGGTLGNLEFARALSKARRLLRDGDRTREPTRELLAAVELAENLGRLVVRTA
ncbi:MAG: hypothetical protein QM704_00665 [Anaeromyxobacteraceae bacterium]